MTPNSDKARDLRERALEIARQNPRRFGDDIGAMPASEIQNMLNELWIHQIELEMQNDELRSTQAELETARTRYLTLYDLAPVGYCTLSESGVIIDANQTAAQLLGLDRSEIIGHFPTRFIFAEDQDVYYLHTKKLSKPGARSVCELRLLRKGIEPFYARLEAVIAQDDGQFNPSCRIVISDITEKKRLESALLRSKELESLGFLAGGIAHDFNNMLTSFLGNISLAREQTDPHSTLYDLLKEAEIAVGQAKTLTQQLLTFSAGGMPTMNPLAVKRLITQSAVFATRGSSSTCEFQFAADLRLTMVDAGQIGQVIHNLVVNADQSMEQGGKIKINVENIELNEGDFSLIAGTYIRIGIGDSGSGISPENMKRIFNPYFTTKKMGKGMGLAICFSIIKKHGGHIEVHSTVGEGTTFEIYLPALNATMSTEVVEPSIGVLKGHGRILVMDDEDSICRLLSRALTQLGYTVAVCANGETAIALYEEAWKANMPFVTVILDLTVIEGMGGKQAIEQLLKINPKIKAVMSSGYANDSSVSNFQALGFSAFLPKPYSIQELSKTLYSLSSS